MGHGAVVVLGSWSLLAAVVIGLLVGARAKPGYLKVLGLAVVEALLLLWVYSLWRLI